MTNKILLYLASLFLIFNNIANANNNIQKAEDAITHATTYHWLARYKNNDARDLLKSKEYFTEALSYLHEDDTTQYTKALRDKAKAGLIDTDVRYENCYDNINNEFPLFNILCGYNKTYELYDDPDVTATNYAVEDAISVIPLPIKNDFQYDVIVISEPVNHELEDEIRVALNGYPQFFPRPVEDILDIISKEEYEELYNDNFSQIILNKLSKKWNKDDLLITKIINNDKVNDVSYLGIYLYEWNKKSNMIVRSVYADGLAQDRRGDSSDRMIWLFFLLLLSVAFAGISKKVFFFKEEKDRRPVYLWSGTYSIVISIIITCGLIYLFRPLAPNPTSLAILPHSRLWILCFHILIVLVPIIITYLIAVMTPKLNERLYDGETITSLISGVGIGMFFVLFSIYVMKFPNNDLYHYIIPMVILFYFYSVWTGHHLSIYFLENNKLSIIPLVSFIFILEIFVYCLMSNNFNLLYLADSSLILFPMFFHGFRKYSINRNLLEEKEKNFGRHKEINIKSLHVQINDPEKFIDPSPSDNFVSNKVNEITENISLEDKKKLKVVLLLGQQGSGKTRMAKELANKIIEKYDSINPEGDKSGNWILFGDCDELNQSGSGVPFEPFSQALHEILGAGRFEPPAKKANKIKEGINSTGLGGILDVGGLGVLNMILGAQDEEIQPATTSEMAQIIIQTLVGLSKNRPVIFIIDDLHWIDPISYNLFKEVLNKLPERSHANIYLIFTSRPITKINTETQIDPVNDLTNNKTLQLSLIEDEDFQYKNKFNEILIESLHFDQRSAQKYIAYTKSYEVSNILSFLQTIKSIIEDDGIKIINNKVIIRKKYDFTTLRPPTDIQNVVEQQLKTLTENQLRIIKFASFLGREFKASILSEALKMRRLHILYDLEAMEDLGILNDIRNQDDVYEFKSNAIINVLRFMAKESEGHHNEIPQIVREYHYRVAQSIKSKMKSGNNSMLLLNDQDLYNLAKRSWAAGDRMLSDAFKYNYEALLRSYNHLRYEESVEYGTNLISIIEQQDNCNQTIDNLRIHLLIAQSRIILELDSESTDEVIEEAKSILNNSSEDIDKELWRLVILNVEADALIHDHSGYFEKQREDILAQINDVIIDSSHISDFEILYASLSQLRLDNDISHKDKYKKIKSLLEKLRNSDINNKEQTETPLSGFCNDPNIDFKILESEILEELIHIMYILKVDSNEIIKYIEECEKIKSSKEINDKEGLVLVYHYSAKCYSELGNKEKADYYYNETINFGKKIGNDHWESRGRIGRGKLMLESGNYDDSLAEYRSVCKLKIWDDKEIQYQVCIGMLNISNLNNDEVLKEEFLQDAENLIQEDENKGYLYEELQKLIAEAN